MSEHDQFRELIEGYALGSLDQAEQAQLEAHLASRCTECAAALAEAACWLATQLGHLAPAAEPSEMLRARLLQTVRAEGSATQQALWPRRRRAQFPSGCGRCCRAVVADATTDLECEAHE